MKDNNLVTFQLSQNQLGFTKLGLSKKLPQRKKETEACHETLRTIKLLGGKTKISWIHWRKCSCSDPHTLTLQMDSAQLRHALCFKCLLKQHQGSQKQLLCQPAQDYIYIHDQGLFLGLCYLSLKSLNLLLLNCLHSCIASSDSQTAPFTPAGKKPK